MINKEVNILSLLPLISNIPKDVSITLEVLFDSIVANVKVGSDPFNVKEHLMSVEAIPVFLKGLKNSSMLQLCSSALEGQNLMFIELLDTFLKKNNVIVFYVVDGKLYSSVTTEGIDITNNSDSNEPRSFTLDNGKIEETEHGYLYVGNEPPLLTSPHKHFKFGMKEGSENHYVECLALTL